MTERAKALMREICVELGWCDGLANLEQLFSATETITAEDFALQVLRADGIDTTATPDVWTADADALRAAFIRHMGGGIAVGSEFD